METATAAVAALPPLAVFLCCLLLRQPQFYALFGLVFGLILLSLVVGSLQFTSGGNVFDFFNSSHRSNLLGFFANRNHQGLMLAIGVCIYAGTISLTSLDRGARIALLLAGVMPQDIERAFAASGKRLFPFKLQEVRSECSCPDKANPCKHVSAVFYLMGDRFSEDPFVLFQLRGRTRSQLLSDLAKRRRKLLARAAASKAAADRAAADGPPQPDAAGPLRATHAAIADPSRWWRYDAALDPNLVVITPALEGDTGLDAAGPLPLAEEPRFPGANRLFLEQLKEQAQQLATAAMATAMDNGSSNDG